MMWRAIVPAVLILVHMNPAAAAERPTTPSFSDYPVALTFRGKVAPVDISSDPDARRFQTRLREGEQDGPNFADHFTLVTWECGTDCNVIAVIDAMTGAVAFGGGFDVGISFRRDSRLVILNPPELVAQGWQFPNDCEQPGIPETTYLEWTGKAFTTILVSDPCAAWKKRASSSALR